MYYTHTTTKSLPEVRMPYNPNELKNKIIGKEINIGIVGLGYVGLPLAIQFCKKGFNVIGFDIDPYKVHCLKHETSYLSHVDPESFIEYIQAKKFFPTSFFENLTFCAVTIVCVPTPLTANREPDLSYIKATMESIQPYVGKYVNIVSLESTTYPGTTNEVVRPILEKEAAVGKDFALIYSPEREDPGNPFFSIGNTPKVVGGQTETCGLLGKALYQQIVDTVILVSSTNTAEMVKILENTYRAVNISFVNELKMLCHKMGIDIFEVIRAAQTKPFGFQAFRPSCGFGGHCIKEDPFYLTWKARQYDINTKFIELSGEINSYMPEYVSNRIQDALNSREKSIKNSVILIIGVAYKPNVNDTRESPAFRIIDLLHKKGGHILYHDPFIPILPETRKYNFKLKSQDLSKDLLNIVDCVVIVTAHKDIDYKFIQKYAKIIVDTCDTFRDKTNVYCA